MMVRPTPPVQRALQETVEKLRRAGHDMVDWEPKLHNEAVQTLVSLPKLCLTVQS